MSIIVQQDATMYSLLYIRKLLYMFRVVTPAIIRSTYNCNYSIWHWSNFGKCGVWNQLKMRVSATFRDLRSKLRTLLCYLPQSKILDLRSREVAETVGSITLIFNRLHTLHFPKFDQCQMLQSNYSYMCSWCWVELPAERRRAVYRNIINCTQSHLVGQLLTLIHDARTHEHKKKEH
jgi:hypothetical protein